MPYLGRTFGHLEVQQVIPLDYRRPGVRQHGKRDAAPAGEIRERRGRVIAHRDEPEALPFQRRHPALQLHELRLAVGSPVGRAEEHQQRALRPEQRQEAVRLAVLIREGEVGCGLAYLGTTGVELRTRGPGRLSQQHSPGGDASEKVINQTTHV